MKAITILLGTLAAAAALSSGAKSASAHTVEHVEGKKWIVHCDDGSAFTFGGSEEGAVEVAGLLCPPPPPPPPLASATGSVGVRVVPDAETVVTTDRRGRAALKPGAAAVLAFRGYPPHGYPCLGCEPCPGNPTEFCDIVGIRMHPGALGAGWRKTADGRVRRELRILPDRR